MLSLFNRNWSKRVFLGSDHLILMGGGGCWAGSFFEKKNPGPNFARKNIQDRVNSIVHIVINTVNNLTIV